MTHPSPTTRTTKGPTMLAELRSEWTRARRKGVLITWLGLTAVLVAVVNSVMFSVATKSHDDPQAGPGVAFPSLATLQGVHGPTAALSTAANMLGLVALSCAAVLTAVDYSTGLVRILAAAQPRRWRLLAGKLAALAILTSAAAAVATAATLVSSRPAADAAGVDTTSWSGTGAGDVLAASGRLYVTLFAWVCLGVVLATLTRSAAASISVGAGYLLLLEGIVSAALSSAKPWLPGSVLTAVAQGGTKDTSFSAALGLAAIYTAVGLAAAWYRVTTRDITD